MQEMITESPKMIIRAPEGGYCSSELDQLFGALAIAQGEYEVIGYNRENPYFKAKFADLDAILSAARPALKRNKLTFLQQIRINEEGMTILHSILGHASGQWIESRNRIIPTKNDPQTFGSTLSYLKRYAAVSLLGITISHDKDDDDAEKDMADARQIFVKSGLNTKYNPKEESSETITKEQLEELEYELAEHADIATQILDGLRLQSLADLPKSKFLISVKRIREIKSLRTGK
jgi:hypothetical protein